MTQFRFLSLLLPVFLSVTTEGAHHDARDSRNQSCRLEETKVLLVERLDAAASREGFYSATFWISILFASDAPNTDLDMGTSLRLTTTKKGHQTEQTLGFEHFEQVRKNHNNEISMTVKAMVPMGSPTIEISFTKDGIRDFCGPSTSLVLDRQECIDIVSAQLTLLNRGVGPHNEDEYRLSVRLKSTESNLANTNVRLPPSDQIGWSLSADGEYLVDSSKLEPERVTHETSASLTFHGTVLLYTSSYYPPNIEIAAFDKSRSTRSCGNSYFVEADVFPHDDVSA